MAEDPLVLDPSALENLNPQEHYSVKSILNCCFRVALFRHPAHWTSLHLMAETEQISKR